MVCEILDPRTQATIQANMNFACMSDFLQSNDMVGKILAMVSEEILVTAILDELLEANRCQLQVLITPPIPPKVHAYIHQGAVTDRRGFEVEGGITAWYASMVEGS